MRQIVAIGVYNAILIPLIVFAVNVRHHRELDTVQGKVIEEPGTIGIERTMGNFFLLMIGCIELIGIGRILEKDWIANTGFVLANVFTLVGYLYVSRKLKKNKMS